MEPRSTFSNSGPEQPRIGRVSTFTPREPSNWMPSIEAWPFTPRVAEEAPLLRLAV